MTYKSISWYNLGQEGTLLRAKLWELGKAIRQNPNSKEQRKKHGSYWSLTLPNGVRFTHDDYNHAVYAFYLDGTSTYFGMEFGGVELGDVTIEMFESAILAVQYSKGEPG